MSTVVQAQTRTRDPQTILNNVQPHIRHLTINVTDGGTIWEREIALLLRDNIMVRNMAERILANAVMYTITAMEHPDVHLGVGKIVDIGVHQHGGQYKHHAPFVQRRSDDLCLRTADFLRSNGFDIDGELWAIDGANCSPCDSKVPDSH